eukprot:scaffold93716_cov67-Phaeocystis_antarctica.AAC.3
MPALARKPGPAPEDDAVPRETGATCAPRGHAYNPAHAGSNCRAVRGRPRTRHPHGGGWEGQPRQVWTGGAGHDAGGIRAVRVSSQGPRPAMRLLCTALRV